MAEEECQFEDLSENQNEFINGTQISLEDEESTSPVIPVPNKIEVTEFNLEKLVSPESSRSCLLISSHMDGTTGDELLMKQQEGKENDAVLVDNTILDFEDSGSDYIPSSESMSSTELSSDESFAPKKIKRLKINTVHQKTKGKSLLPKINSIMILDENQPTTSKVKII